MKILNIDEVLELFKGKISAEQTKEMKRVDAVFPVRISEYYAKLAMENEAAFKQAFPSHEELDKGNFGETDPLSEATFEKATGLIHKYKNKAIILTTNMCFMNCRHCTRKRLMHGTSDMTPPDYAAIFDYLAQHTEINDILLTGGDVLSLKDDFLLAILYKLQKLPHINTIRLGTRAPVTCPERIRDDLFNELGNIKNLWLNTQFNHPCELTSESLAACGIIQKYGIPICNQTVVLKGINDDYNVLRDLFLGLVHNRIIPYYLYQCDNVAGVSHFITSPTIGANVVRQLRLDLPGIAIPRYIIDTGYGKIVSEYGNVKSLSETCAELLAADGSECTMKYEINSPKNG